MKLILAHHDRVQHISEYHAYAPRAISPQAIVFIQHRDTQTEITVDMRDPSYPKSRMDWLQENMVSIINAMDRDERRRVRQ